MHIMNSKGNPIFKAGIMTAGFKPCNEKGETEVDKLPDEFKVKDARLLLNKENLYFKVYVNFLNKLPPTLCTY